MRPATHDPYPTTHRSPRPATRTPHPTCPNPRTRRTLTHARTRPRPPHRPRPHRGLRPHRRPADRGAGRHATARSTGCACRASTRPPASPRCSATTDNGRWLIAPAGRAAVAPRAATADDTLVLETECETADGRRRGRSTSCRRATARPDVVRIVEGVSRHGRRCAWSCGSASTTAAIVPWVRRVERRTWRGRRPGPVWLRTPVALPTARTSHRRRLHGRRRASGALRPDLASLARARRPSRSTRSRRCAATEDVLARLGGAAARYDGRLARRGASAR